MLRGVMSECVRHHGFLPLEVFQLENKVSCHAGQGGCSVSAVFGLFLYTLFF